MKSCLVVDDSKVIRKVARHILETLDFSVDEAEDGREALVRCEARMPDVVDILPLPAGLMPATEAGEVRGVLLVGEDQAELLDLHWLFARHGGRPSAGAARPVCAIPTGDPFMDAILRPLVESAGYTVVAAGSPGSEAASVVIASAEAGEAPPPEGARVVRIRSASDGPEDSVHRYDREALLAALAGDGPARRRRRRG